MITELDQNKIIKFNCFELLNLPVNYKIDYNQLNIQLHILQKKFHPDNWVNNDSSSSSLIVSAHINSCYTTLKNPLYRAITLLNIKGFPLDLTKDTVVPQKFLMEQMELHELINDAYEDLDKLEEIEKSIIDKQNTLITKLEEKFDLELYLDAQELTKQLKFYNRLLNSINDKISKAY